MRLCIVYVDKEVVSLRGLGRLMGVVRKKNVCSSYRPAGKNIKLQPILRHCVALWPVGLPSYRSKWACLAKHVYGHETISHVLHVHPFFNIMAGQTTLKWWSHP